MFPFFSGRRLEEYMTKMNKEENQQKTTLDLLHNSAIFCVGFTYRVGRGFWGMGAVRGCSDSRVQSRYVLIITYCAVS